MNTEVIIIVSGGVVQDVFASNDTISVDVLDYDNMQQAEGTEYESYVQMEKNLKKLKHVY